MLRCVSSETHRALGNCPDGLRQLIRSTARARLAKPRLPIVAGGLTLGRQTSSSPSSGFAGLASFGLAEAHVPHELEGALDAEMPPAEFWPVDPGSYCCCSSALLVSTLTVTRRAEE